MPKPHHVLMADFLEETTVEAPVLAGIADLTLGRGHHESDLLPHMATAEAMILYHDIPMVTDATFAAAPRLKVLVRAGVGYNNVDRAAAGARGILVCNVPDYGTEEVADHSIMLLLATARRLRPCDDSIRASRWDYQHAFPAPRLRGKTLGLVGCGRIGSATALRAKAFGLDVVFYDPHVVPGHEKALGIRRAETLAELMAQSHFVSIHCYLDDGSHHLIDAAALAAMPPGGLLINTARGPIVDQEALIGALQSGHLAGAGLDVFEREPFDDPRLLDHPGVFLTPHAAFYSVEAFTELRSKAAREARRVLTGEPPWNLVNRPMLQAPRARV